MNEYSINYMVIQTVVYEMMEDEIDSLAKIKAVPTRDKMFEHIISELSDLQEDMKKDLDYMKNRELIEIEERKFSGLCVGIQIINELLAIDSPKLYDMIYEGSCRLIKKGKRKVKGNKSKIIVDLREWCLA